MATSKTTIEGFSCPVRGCPQKNNRRFHTVKGLVMHMQEKHPGEAEKRLRAKRSRLKKYGDSNTRNMG